VQYHSQLNTDIPGNVKTSQTFSDADDGPEFHADSEAVVDDNRQEILDCLGKVFPALDELRTASPDCYRQKMTLPGMPAGIKDAPAFAVAIGHSVGQRQGLYADNYLK